MSSENSKINTEIIIEILGRPKEHLVKTLEDIINQINNEKGVKVENKKIHEPNPVKDREDFFSTYAVVELELDELINLILVLFKYMPSNIEITYPEKLVFKNSDLSETLNEITRRLHKYDEIARIMESEKKILENKLKSTKDE
jgi:hypothetical protein